MAVDLIRQSSGPASNELDSMMLARYGEDDGQGKLAAFNDSDGPSFSDFLDIINPLQHIPVVSAIYQAVTGDHQGAVSEVVGGILWGGPIGLVGAMADLAVEDGTGKTIGANLASLFTGEAGPDAIQTAAAAPAAPAEPVQPVQPVPVEVTTTQGPAANAVVPPVAPPGDAVTAGDYLIFGTSPAVKAAPPAAAATVPAPAPAPAKPAVVAAAPAAPAANGDFMVFGADSRPTSLLPGDNPAPAEADRRFRPVPARTGPAEPRAALPMATTGPAAVPGRSGLNSEFVGRMNAALDKYQKAAKLTDGPAEEQ